LFSHVRWEGLERTHTSGLRPEVTIGGFNPGTQTITDLPKTKIRGRAKKKDVTIPKKARGEVCVNCRTEIPGNINLCPKCGLNPGVQTITDIGKWKGKTKGD
jgi:hypothetical protein